MNKTPSALPSVAVIGAGSTGISMLKTLREDGFDATLFERRSCVGGLWSYTDDKSMITALPSRCVALTVAISHDRNNQQVSLFIQSKFPNLTNKLALLGTRLLMRQYGEIDPSFRLLEGVAPLSLNLVGCMDSVLHLLCEGKATSLHGIKRFTGPRSIEFEDGTILDDVDSVIYCTGYKGNFDLVPFLETSRPETDGKGHPYGGAPMYRLYMNIFPPAYADSIAILAYSAFGKNNGFSFSDVTSMAVSNVWRGVSADMIPSRPEMERAIDRYQQWVAGRWYQENRFDPSAVKQWEFQGFLHKAAGTGMENLGWGWRGWVSWFKDLYMCYLINHGVETAHAFRYFETGKRWTWDGARDAIIHTNQLVKQLKAPRE